MNSPFDKSQKVHVRAIIVFMFTVANTHHNKVIWNKEVSVHEEIPKIPWIVLWQELYSVTTSLGFIAR